MNVGIVFLCVYMLVGAVLTCLSLWLCRRHPDRPGSRALRGTPTQEVVVGFMLACLAWPLAIYIIWKAGDK